MCWAQDESYFNKNLSPDCKSALGLMRGEKVRNGVLASVILSWRSSLLTARGFALSSVDGLCTFVASPLWIQKRWSSFSVVAVFTDWKLSIFFSWAEQDVLWIGTALWYTVTVLMTSILCRSTCSDPSWEIWFLMMDQRILLNNAISSDPWCTKSVWFFLSVNSAEQPRLAHRYIEVLLYPINVIITLLHEQHAVTCLWHLCTHSI